MDIGLGASSPKTEIEGVPSMNSLVRRLVTMKQYRSFCGLFGNKHIKRLTCDDFV